jgi:fatty-acyl-CoA synthase
MRTVVDEIVDRAGGSCALTVLGGAGETIAAVPWAVVHEQARRMATVLAAGGVGRGSRVGLAGDTGVDLVAALQAVWLLGAAVTVLPPPARGRLGNLVAIAADAGLDLVVAELDVAPLAEVTRVVSLVALAASARAAVPASPHRPAPDDLALLQYTSGSTRAPRGVPVTHRHLAANIAAIKEAIDFYGPRPTRMMSWLPLYHDMGLVGFLILPMSAGCALVVQSPLSFARRPASWFQALSKHRSTTTGAPNFAYHLMTRLLGADQELDLRAVRFMLTGGEPVDAQMMGRFAVAAGRYGLDPLAIVPAYGLAESTLAVTFSALGAGVRVDDVDPGALEHHARAVPATPGGPARRLVRLGPPVRGTTLRVVDRHTGAPVGERVVGHVEIRGPSVVGHYWGEPRPPAGCWLRTGDLGYLVDGELVVCGRHKDVLFAAGRNIFPQDVEAAAQVPGVRPGAAAAFGVPHDAGDRLVVAVESRAADPAQVRHDVAVAVLDEVGLTPADVVTLPPGRLPRTSSGKLRRAETRRRYLAGEFDGAHIIQPVQEGSVR